MDADATLDAPALRARLQARVAQRIGPLLWALSAAFAFFGLATLAFRPPGATLALALVDGGGAAALAVAALALHARPAAPARANGIAAAALLFTLASSLVAIKLLHLPAQTTNVLLVELVGSAILLSMPWTAALVACSLGGWALVAWSEGLGADWLNAGFALVATSLMALVIQIVRIRDARLTEVLAAANAARATRLERDVVIERERARELTAANDSLEAFTYVVAHDLKEPIRATRTWLEEAQDAQTRPERDEMLKRAVVSHRELERLVLGLLDWSRATSTPLEPEPVDVRALLDDPVTRQVFERPLQERRARLLIDSAMPQVLATPPLLRQALGNLILNAVKHADKPAPEIHVYAAHDAPRGTVDLVVEDNGPGFPPALLPALADRRGGPSTVRKGFGLAIAIRAVQRLGGQIHFLNREGGPGAQVHLVLPAVNVKAEELAKRVRELV